jgi:hypothetical protein
MALKYLSKKQLQEKRKEKENQTKIKRETPRPGDFYLSRRHGGTEKYGIF